MNDLEMVRVSFTCSRCGALNELTAAHLHDATAIHCSRCSILVAPLGVLARRALPDTPSQHVAA